MIYDGSATVPLLSIAVTSAAIELEHTYHRMAYLYRKARASQKVYVCVT